MQSSRISTAVRRLRKATVAGYYYPSGPQQLREELDRLVAEPAAKRQAVAAIVPHGNYAFSGRIVGRTLGRTVIPRRCIVLGPNHSGAGHPWGLMPAGGYQTPLGEVVVDEALTDALQRESSLLAMDYTAHANEHAIEVVLPFLQRLGPMDLSIVPLVIGSDDPVELSSVATALAEVIRQAAEPVLLVASADLTHYEPRGQVARKDAEFIRAIQTLEVSEILGRAETLTMLTCGGGPIACAVEASRLMGATRAELIDYTTSADAGGDPDSAIGYAGLILN